MSKGDVWFLIVTIAIGLANLIAGITLIAVTGPLAYVNKFLKMEPQLTWQQFAATENLCIGAGFLIMVALLLSMERHDRRRNQNCTS